MMQSIQSSPRYVDQLAAKVLAAALSMRCPTAQILKSREESYGFCVEFYASQSCSEELFPFLEEGMYALLAQKEIQTFEMMTSNAIDFLRFHRQKRRAQELKEWSQGLVHTIKIGNYVDFLEEEFDLNQALEDLKALKLIEFTQKWVEGPSRETRVHVRIKGVSAPDSRSLKDVVKRVKEARKSYHAKASHLFTLLHQEGEQGILWLPEGVALKQKLLNFLKHFLKEKSYQEIECASGYTAPLHTLSSLSSLPSFFYTYLESTRLSVEPDLGLYSLDETVSIRAASSAHSFESVVEMIRRLLDSLQLTPHIVVHSEARQVNIYIKDSFDRKWEVARVEIGEKKNPCYVILCLVSVERWLGLLLDIFKGALRHGVLAEIFKS